MPHRHAAYRQLRSSGQPYESQPRVPSRLFIALGIATITALALWINFKIEQIDLEIALSDQHEETIREASLLAARIQSETNSTFYLIVGLARLIEINGGISNEQFNDICSELVRSRPGLVNIAAAPDMVIRYIYPLEGNEAAMGLDYAQNTEQREAAFRVKESGQTVIAGPVNLVQGGEAVIGRFPVYIRSEQDGTRTFWGLISTPLDTSVLYSECGLSNPSLTLEICLRGRDALGENGDVFFGSEEVEKMKPVYFPIELLSGSWQMAALPKGGWLKTSPNAWWIRTSTGAFTLLLGLLIWLAYQQSLKEKRIREAEQLASLIKERFYANMSHELRTPLNGICGLSDLIESSSKDAEIRGFAKIILQSAEALTRLLDDVLRLSRDELGDIESEYIEPEPFLSNLLPPLIHEATSKSVEFIRKPIPPESAVVWSNPSMMRQILWNLLSNAIKFTESGSVTLDISAPHEGYITYQITDTGIGIAEENIDKVFEDFVQEDNSNTRSYEGAGLGLAVVERFVTRLNGVVTVESEKGHGSQFTVKLPYREMPLA